MQELASQIYGLGEGPVYIKVSPDLPDFTVHQFGKIFLYSSKGVVEISFDRHTIGQIWNLLDVGIFTGRVVLTWSIKNLVSYCKRYTNKKIDPPPNLFDLQVIEGYLGEYLKAPETFIEAMNRAKKLSTSAHWKTIYKTIHLPLMFHVLPKLETQGLVHEDRKRVLYTHYDIEQTWSGRLKCRPFAMGYNPHSLKIDDLKNLRPRDTDSHFLCFDYAAMEVVTLSYLSKDPVLQSVIESEDIYGDIWNRITNMKPDRLRGKLVFLPIVYGMGPEKLSEALGVSRETGTELHRRIYKTFPKAFDYIKSFQDIAAKGPVTDHFGRVRTFEQPHTSRNFIVQSPAALICLEKLIAVSSIGSGLIFSVHDGYTCIVKEKLLRDTCDEVCNVLETPGEFCPDLSIKVQVKSGKSLANLQTFPAKT